MDSLPRALALALCALMSACQSGPTMPTSSGYNGQWSGTTSQGMAISFTVSPDEKVTAITIGHNFNGCSGSQTFSNLNLATAPDVMCIPGPCAPSISAFRSFGYAAGLAEGPSTQVHGLFLSNSRAEGSAGFRDFPGCGSVIGVAWTATKR